MMNCSETKTKQNKFITVMQETLHKNNAHMKIVSHETNQNFYLKQIKIVVK